jgi:hypothetical protein
MHRKRRVADRVARPIFSSGGGRIVEPIEGWASYHIDDGWEQEDPLIREWFKIGELLHAELAELDA